MGNGVVEEGIEPSDRRAGTTSLPAVTADGKIGREKNSTVSTYYDYKKLPRGVAAQLYQMLLKAVKMHTVVLCGLNNLSLSGSKLEFVSLRCSSSQWPMVDSP